MWSEGTIGIPEADDKYKVIHYWVKHYEEPSDEYGINGGKISKLTLKVDGGDIEPTCKEAEMALGILLNNYN